MRPKVYLVALGPEPTHRRRVAFMREWLEAGGFEAVYDGEAVTAEEAAIHLKASGAPLVCLCGADESYAGRVKAFAESDQIVRREGPRARGPARRSRGGMARRGRRRFYLRRRRRCAALQGLYRRIGVQL